MSNNRIFTSPRQVQGRNANIAVNMSKRNPIFNHLSEKQEISPFAGYNFNSSENVFSTSQVSEFSSTQKLGTDIAIIRKLIKEQMEKHNFLQDQNKKLISTSQAQINDLKEKFADFQKKSVKYNQQQYLSIRQEMSGMVQKLSNQNCSEITSNLRKVFQKSNQQLKRQIIRYAEKQFVPISIIDQLQQVYQKVQSIQQKISQNSINVSENSKEKTLGGLLPQHTEAKINKIQRQMESLKKYLKQTDEKFAEFKSMRDQVREGTEFLGIQKERTKKIQIQLLQIQKKLSVFETSLSNGSTDIDLLREKVANLQKNSDQNKFIIKDLHKKYSSFESRESQNKSQVAQFLKGSQNFDTSIILNSSENQNINGQPMIEKILVNENNNSSLLSQKTDRNSLKTDRNDFTKDRDIQNQQILAEENGMKKSLYQIDKQGYLMDEDGRYLLTEANTMVKLSEQQIRLLSETDFIQFS